jgi:hypothetical protein
VSGQNTGLGLYDVPAAACPVLVACDGRLTVGVALEEGPYDSGKGHTRLRRRFSSSAQPYYTLASATHHWSMITVDSGSLDAGAAQWSMSKYG